jgi:hypothetical protein
MKLKLSLAFLSITLLLMLSVCKESNHSTLGNMYLNLDTAVHYVGIEACQSCHYDKFVTFIETGMGQSFKKAHLLKSSANFNNQIPVYDSFLNFYYLPFATNNNIYIKEYRLENNDTVYSRIEKISYIVGSGHHTNSHFTEENGFIYQAPLTFYTQKGKWDLPPGFEKGNNTRFSRKIGLECMSCHNAMPNLLKNSDNQYIDLPHGINCERCHGPGELHVKYKSQGIVVDTDNEIDYSIVNPSKLSWERQIDVCQRCHLQGNAVLKPGKTYTDFRPGMNLSSVFDQFSPEFESGDEFVMAAHAERFQKSKCFIASQTKEGDKANYGFTCISCHNPHVSVRQTNTQVFNQKCQSCHSNNSQTICDETEVNRKTKDYNCVSCHMPSSGTSDIPHVSVHDHYIRKPQKGGESATGKLIGLRCITNKKPDVNTITEAYTSYYEKFDPNPLYLNLALKNSQKLSVDSIQHVLTLIHLFYISQDYNKIIELSKKIRGNEDAWCNYRIAKAFERLSKNSEALLWFDRAIQLQNKNLDFVLQYSLLLIKMNDLNKAKEMLLYINGLYSKNEEVWAALGLIYMKQQSFLEAKKHFQKALSLNPDLLLALQNLRELNVLLGNVDEVQKLEKRISAIKQSTK